MSCHNHGRCEQTLEDILTPAEMGQLHRNLDDWRRRTIEEIKGERCVCRSPWPEYGHGKPGYSHCSRCITLYRFRVQCCDADGPVRPRATGELSPSL